MVSATVASTFWSSGEARDTAMLKRAAPKPYQPPRHAGHRSSPTLKRKRQTPGGENTKMGDAAIPSNSTKWPP